MMEHVAENGARDLLVLKSTLAENASLASENIAKDAMPNGLLKGLLFSEGFIFL